MTPTSLQLPLASLLESPWQPPGRSERGLDELVASMRATGPNGEPRGIIEPLVVRDLPDGGYRIVSGGRRRRAGIEAGLTEALCVVRELTDEEEHELFYVSNAVRVDLTHLEEADHFGGLVAIGWSPDRIAERTGKGRATVYRRLLLLKLTSESRGALEQGEISIGVAERLASVAEPAAQNEALEDLRRYDEPSLKQAGYVVERYHLVLADVPWRLDDAALVPAAGACTGCPKRTSSQLALIGEAVPKADRCTDRICFEAKRAAVWEAKKREAERLGAKIIEGKEAEKLCPYGFLRDHSYVDLNSRFDHDPPAVSQSEGDGIFEDDDGNEIDGEEAPEVAPGERTWREALAGHVKPEAVVLTPDGKIRELVKREDAAKALRAAGLKGAARDEERRAAALSSLSTDPKSGAMPPEHELQRKAMQRASAQALTAIVEKAERKKNIDEKVWRHLVAVLVHGARDGALVETAERRGIEVFEKDSPDDAQKALLEHAKSADLATLFGLAIELTVRADDAFPPEHPVETVGGSLEIAARFAEVDVEQLYKDELKAVKAEARAAAKKKAEKAKAKKKTQSEPGLGVVNDEVVEPKEPGSDAPNDALRVACPRCKAKPGEACRHPDGQTHERRIKASKLEGQAEMAAASPASGSVSSETRGLPGETTAAASESTASTISSSCRVCGCTDAEPCLHDVAECTRLESGTLCSFCAELMQDIEERLEHRPRYVEELIAEILDESQGPYTEERVGAAIDELKAREAVVALLSDDRGWKIARQEKLRFPPSAAAAPEPPKAPAKEHPLAVGDRVTIKAGGAGTERWAGRTGTVAKACKPPFADMLYVKIDLQGRERTPKTEMLRVVDVERVGAPLPASIRAPGLAGETRASNEEPAASPERSPTEQAARTKAIKTKVHHVRKLITGKKGRAAMQKLCELLPDPPTDFVSEVAVADVSCDECKTAWGALR